MRATIDHELNFDTPSMCWDEGLSLGNGNLGALVWGDDHPVNISIDRTDIWDLRPVSEYQSEEYSYQLMRQWEEEGRIDCLKRVYENPYRRPGPTKIPLGRIELEFDANTNFQSAKLSLEEATASFCLEGSIVGKVYIHANKPIGFILVSGCDAPQARLRPPLFKREKAGNSGSASGSGSLADLGYDPPKIKSGGNRSCYEQEGWNGFRFAVCLVWETSREEEKLWRAAWTIATSNDDKNPATWALNQLKSALSTDPIDLYKSHKSWWKKYWSQSSLQVPDFEIERQWYLDTYKFGAASRRGSPPISLQGPWTADNDRLPPWKGDYHHDLNTQLCYWSCYSGNHLEEGLSFLDWLWETRENCVDWTKRFFGLPGMNIPMTADLNNSQIGGWRQYAHSATTGAWLAHHFYLHWKFSMDHEFLQKRAYPYLHECAVFIEAITKERDEEGWRSLPLSSSPEINSNKPEAWFPSITNHDLALIRKLLTSIAEAADEVGKRNEAKYWRDILGEFPMFSLGQEDQLLVAKGYSLTESHRHFSHLMAIHPLNLINWKESKESREVITASLNALQQLGTENWCGYSFAWLANLAARAYDGEIAAKALKIFTTAFTLRNGFHCNGDQSEENYSKYHYRPMTLEGNFAAAAGLQEMLLQSHTGIIEILPAIPSSWKDVSFRDLRAQGAFLVSAAMKDGQLDYFEIKSEKGGNCRFRLPFAKKTYEFSTKPGEIITKKDLNV